MSIFFKAHGTPSIGLLLIRFSLGSYMLSLGIIQASNIEAYITKLKALHIVSENLSFMVGFVTPFLLIIFGALYIMGFFTPASSLVLGAIQLLKIFVGGVFVSGGNPFNKDIIFFFCFVLTLFAGAGVFSFDVLLDKKKKKVKTEDSGTAIVTAEIITEPVSEEPKTE